MQIYKNEMQLCFDDILLVPQPSDVSTRSEVVLSSSIGFDSREIELYFPIIASPMDTVCETEMAFEIAKHGGLGIIHRYMDFEQQKNMVFDVARRNYLVGAAVGVKDDYLKKIEALAIVGAKVICIDTANGHNSNVEKSIRHIRKNFPDLHIMAGNVSTWDAFLELSNAGADSIRVGIGGGSMCTTIIVTGHGMPTLSSIMDIQAVLERMSLPTSIIADGGIRNTGDMVKSFAAGADAVMLGSILAGHDESPGDILYDKNNSPYKKIRGMASEEAQKEWRGSVSVSEGISTNVEYRGSVEKTFQEIRGGISSGCSYSGVSHLSDLAYNSQYVTVSSNTVKESRPHGENA